MKWYWITLICVGGVAVLYTLLAFLVAKIVLNMATKPKRFTFDEARKRQSEAEHIDFSDYDKTWRKEKFCVNGVHGKISGEFVFNEESSPRAKVVVICHGHSWNRLTSVKYARIFYAKGYNLVLYDHAYFGESEGDYTTLGMYESRDLNAVLDAVRKKFGADAFVGLHGESMGAATVLLELGLRHDIDFVIADCPFSDTMKFYRELCREAVHLPSFPIVDFANAISKRKFGYDFKKVKPIEAVAQSEVPICFIHGKADRYIFPSNSEKMYAVCKNRLSEIHIVEGAAHARSYRTNNQQYRKIVCDFLDKVENSELNPKDV